MFAPAVTTMALSVPQRIPFSRASFTMSKVWLPSGRVTLKYRARKLRIISADPKRVKRKNLIAAY